MEKLLTSKQVAAMLHLHINTVLDWCKEGVIKPAYKLPGGRWRIPESSVAGLLGNTEK